LFGFYRAVHRYNESMSELDSKLYTAEQVRCLDSCAIDKQGIAGFELMSRAGKAVFELAESKFPAAREWVVVCGAGNNAGDGYIVAGLALSAGKSVQLYALAAVEKLSGDAQSAALAWLAQGGTIAQWPPDLPSDMFGSPDLIIDALLGTGLDRSVQGLFLEAIEWMNRMDCPGVAVDIPSGINANSGQAMALAYHADYTLCFIGMKHGLLTCDGPDHSGEVVFDSLDIPQIVYDSVKNHGFIIRDKILSHLLRRRSRNSHKGQYGHVLIAGGNAGMSGAAQLAGEAALRSGAGLVTIATHPSHAAFLNMARPELMVSGVSMENELEALLAKATVLALGPGLGSDLWAHEIFTQAIGSTLPMLIDADGLNLLAQNPRKVPNSILTPHPAEAGRLLGTSTAQIQSSRIESARLIASQYDAVVVLKGCGTVVANPDGAYSICPLGNSGMATAGSGDVLSGIIAAFLAQGLTPWSAAQAGVVAHAVAGDLAAQSLGERYMLAGDIITNLSQVLR
jgi:hydroxyethylthiazole kinase-like uncharacterized protein yjeF